MREVDISAHLLPRHHEVMRCLGLLSRTVNTDLWCLVGGMMVLVAARSAGRTNPRSEGTKDGDIVVDVVAEPGMLGKVSHALTTMGYTLPPEDGHSTDFTRCRFVSGSAQVDVLAPDDAPAERLDVGTEVRSLAIPGGRRALVGSELTSIYYAEDAHDVVLRVSSLTGAICVKAAAATDARTADHPRHIQDVAFLLSCIDDPLAAATELGVGDRELLRGLQEDLSDDGHVGWRYLDRADRDRATASLDFIVADPAVPSA